LIDAAEQFYRHRDVDARDRLDALEQAERKRIDEAQAAVHQQQVGACLGDQVLDPRFHALEHAEEREGHAHLKKNQDATSGLAPDAGPDQGQESHAVLGTGKIPRRRAFRCAAATAGFAKRCASASWRWRGRL
jgi:hypothetical protein